MRKFVRQDARSIIAIDTDCIKKAQRKILSNQSPIEGVKVREDEDSAFGGLEMFFNNSPEVRRRIKKFFS